MSLTVFAPYTSTLRPILFRVSNYWDHKALVTLPRGHKIVITGVDGSLTDSFPAPIYLEQLFVGSVNSVGIFSNSIACMYPVVCGVIDYNLNADIHDESATASAAGETAAWLLINQCQLTQRKPVFTILSNH